MSRTRLINAALAFAALTISNAAADPLLTKAQIAKAAHKIEACLKKQYEAPSGGQATKCVGIVKGECDDNISAGGEAAHATCSDNETAVWDVLLNKTWGELPDELGPERFAALKQVQKLWLSYRTANCGFLNDPKNPGVWGMMLSADCRMDETARRTIELRDILSDPNFAAPE
jgi:uncharacterized protein YecT (DUF1311 family)